MKLMKVDFFDNQKQTEPLRSDVLFGINDGVQERGETTVSYTTTEGDQNQWHAIVYNKKSHPVLFVPLDHNFIIHPTEGTTYSLCDGMLYHKPWLAFVELKVKKENWIQKDIQQLRSTINLFQKNHDVSAFPKRFAYAVNRKHPYFPTSKKAEMQKFRNETGFRLLIQREIKVL